MRQEQQPTEDRIMDVLGSMPPESGKLENQFQPSQPVADDAANATQQAALGDMAALAHTLVGHLPTESALPRALAICARLLPSARSLRLFALLHNDPDRLSLVAEVTHAGGAGAGSGHIAHGDAREVATLGLGEEADARTLRERAVYRSGGTQAMPLEASNGTLVGALVLVGEVRPRSEAAVVALCADSLTVLLERLRQERLTVRVARALDVMPALGSVEASDELGLVASRKTLDEIVALAEPAAALLLAPAEDGRLHAPAESGGGEIALSSMRSVEILGALHGQPSVSISSEESRDLWNALTALRGKLERIGGVAPGRLTLLPIRDGGAVVAVLTLAHGSGQDTGEDWMPAARALVAATEAGLRARRLQREVAAEGRARDEYISLAGHELRSPLTSIKGYAQLLARQSRKSPLPESMLRSVEAIEQQSLRMSEMVGELLDASRIARGRLEMSFSRTDLVPIALKVVERRRSFHPAHTFELDMEADSLAGDWDAMRVEQIVRDLLDNAARFSPEGGLVVLRLAREDGSAVVRVRDQGIGIAADERDHIFDYLYRAPEAEERNLSGLGLGLYICRHVAERMGGRLTLRETRTGEGSGSEFELALPLVTA